NLCMLLNDRAVQFFFYVWRKGIKCICNNDMRSQPASVFENRRLRDERIGVDSNVRADSHVVFDDRRCSDAHIVPDLVLFPDHDMMTGLEVVPNTVPCIDNSMRSNDRIVSDSG